MARSRLRFNFLGFLSILIGVAALVATKIPLLGYGPLPIAGIAVGVGVLGFLLSILTGNYGSGQAVLGIIVGLGALVLVEYEDGTLPRWWAKFFPKSTPAAVTPGNPSSGGGSTSSGPDISHQRSIFDEPGSNTGPANVTPTPTVNAPPATPTIMAQHPAATLPPRAPTITIQQAQAKLDAAKKAVERTLVANPDYVQAQKDVAEADATRKAALASDGAGSAAVQEASTQWLNAKSKLQKLLDAADAKDPATVSAQRDLKEAELNARGVK